MYHIYSLFQMKVASLQETEKDFYFVRCLKKKIKLIVLLWIQVQKTIYVTILSLFYLLSVFSHWFLFINK